MNPCEELANRIINLYVLHPKVEEIWATLDSIRFHRSKKKSAPRHLFIVGQSGVGKSEMLKKYVEHNPGYIHVDEEGTEYDIKPVVFMELPNPFTILEFYQTIIKALGAPPITGVPRIGDVKRRVFTLLKHQKVEMLILDEMSYIKNTKYVKSSDSMEALKHVSNEAGISIVCVGTPDTEELQKSSFQYYRRFSLRKLLRFETCNEEFCNFLTAIEGQVDLPAPIGLGNMETGYPQLLHLWTKGIVERVHTLLIEAFKIQGVLDEGFNDLSKANLTIDILVKAKQITFGSDMDDAEFEKMLSM
ncbi:TniB family NTP-binding protein [Brevibacillus centrosporus]|uniref:TniB family NTP-binding protein n=1 Tax=Brevibacillus centrosporus TaxID=54910 RepID=UPI003D229771